MRRRLIGVPLVLCCVAAAWPSTADACGEFRHARARVRPSGVGRAPLAIGDSTSIFAVQMLRARRRAHTLPHVVALALGANAAVSRGQIAAALRVMGRDRVLALVTA